jgi:hypothetical protein
LHNFIEGNEAWNNAVGINLFSKLQVGNGTQVPSERGGAADTPIDMDNAVPLSFRANVTIGGDRNGLEYWGMPRFPAEDHVSAHNRRGQVWGAPLGQNNVYLRNALLVAAGGRSDCITASSAYLRSIEIDGGQLRGCHVGIAGGMASQSVRLRGVVLQNVINLVYGGLGRPAQSILQDVLHLPLGSNSKQYIRYGNGAVWQPGHPVGKFGYEAWKSQPGSEHVIINWQGTGQDYVLMANQQRRSTPAWPANAPGSLTNVFFVPEAGLTMGEAWDKYGMAFGGDVVGDDAAIELEGLSGGVARAGLDRAPGQPRAVLTVPNMLGPAAVESVRNGPSIQMFVMLTGHDEGASPEAVISIDGGRPVRLGPSRNSEGHRRYVSTAVAPGTHEVRTWREDLRGKKIPGSELVFHYFVQDAAPSTSPARARR